MSIKSKKKEFKFTFGIFIRLVVFIIVTFFCITSLSNNIENKKTSVLGDNIQTKIPLNIDPVYNLLPEDSKKQINILKSATTSAFFQDKIEMLKEQAAGFPQKQIVEIQKQVVTKIYDNIINSIEK